MTVPPPFDPKLFVRQPKGQIYVFGDNDVFGLNDEEQTGARHPRCCWLLPPNGEPFSYAGGPCKQWQLEPYATGSLAVPGTPKQLYALFVAYLLTGHWPSYVEGWPH